MTLPISRASLNGKLGPVSATRELVAHKQIIHHSGTNKITNHSETHESPIELETNESSIELVTHKSTFVSAYSEFSKYSGIVNWVQPEKKYRGN